MSDGVMTTELFSDAKAPMSTAVMAMPMEARLQKAETFWRTSRERPMRAIPL